MHFITLLRAQLQATRDEGHCFLYTYIDHRENNGTMISAGLFMGEYSNVKVSENVIVLLIGSLYVTYNYRRRIKLMVFLLSFMEVDVYQHMQWGRQQWTEWSQQWSPTTDRTEWSQQWSTRQQWTGQNGANNGRQKWTDWNTHARTCQLTPMIQISILSGLLLLFDNRLRYIIISNLPLCCLPYVHTCIHKQLIYILTTIRWVCFSSPGGRVSIDKS